MDLPQVKNNIIKIRGVQVMLDSDLAKLYEVETKRLNEQVRRNIDRFPSTFMFQLTKEEFEELVAICDRFKNLKHSSSLPFAFTEHGVAMLSGILRSKKAIKINIQIIEAFVEMRKIISDNKDTFQRLNLIETRQINFETQTNQKFSEIFDKFQTTTLSPNQGIFFDGQIFDSYIFVTGLIKQAKSKIILIDNYVDETTLNLFSKTKVKTTIYTKITNQLKEDLKQYNKQYNNLELKHFTKSHDRFLIIDNQIYHIGASLKDMGKKWFAFSKLEINILDKLI